MRDSYFEQFDPTDCLIIRHATEVNGGARYGRQSWIVFAESDVAFSDGLEFDTHDAALAALAAWYLSRDP